MNHEILHSISTSSTMHHTLYTPYPTSCPLHSISHIPHSKPYILHQIFRSFYPQSLDPNSENQQLKTRRRFDRVEEKMYECVRLLEVAARVYKLAIPGSNGHWERQADQLVFNMREDISTAKTAVENQVASRRASHGRASDGGSTTSKSIAGSTSSRSEQEMTADVRRALSLCLSLRFSASLYLLFSSIPHLLLSSHLHYLMNNARHFECMLFMIRNDAISHDIHCHLNPKP